MRGPIKSTVSRITAAALLVGLAAALSPVAAQEGARATRTITVMHDGEKNAQGIKLRESALLTVVEGDRIRVLVQGDVWCPKDYATPSIYGSVTIEVKEWVPAEGPKRPSCGFTRKSTKVWRIDPAGEDHYVVLGGRANGNTSCQDWIEITYVDDNCRAPFSEEVSNNFGVQVVPYDSK